jgi:hypothetical protein
MAPRIDGGIALNLISFVVFKML